MSISELYAKTIEYFSKEMPTAETELNYTNPFELLVAVILSAQCTDKRVNLITPPLFRRYPTPDEMAKATPDEIFDFIRSCSYPNNKSKHLVGMAQALCDKFDGVVPSDINDLMQLPGVGRKTANVILTVIFKIPAMPVDTHVFRVAARIGLTKNSKTPLETERQLTKYIPPHLLNIAHHWFILHGRYVCTAKNPHCKQCGLNKICSYFDE